MKYYFPFERCLLSGYTQVFIFGAGEIGCHFQKQILEKKSVTNRGYIDNFATTETVSDIVKQVGIYKPEHLRTAEYDCIVLACRYELIPEICECLYNIGVKCEKIILPLFCSSFTTANVGSAWDGYYEIAESHAVTEVEKYFLPLLSKHEISFNRVLDFPSGRGRIAERFYKLKSEKIDRIMCCDANSKAIEYCRERFSDNDKFTFMVNKVDKTNCHALEIKNSCFSFIYSWDAMVHFSYKWLDFYIGEFFRILEDNGYAFIHHSNLDSPDVMPDVDKSENWNENPHWRSLISSSDIRYIAEKHGFNVVEQRIIDWGDVPQLDCITLLKKQVLPQ